MSKEIIDLLENVVQRYRCPVCAKYSGDSNSPSKHWNDCPVGQALNLLKQQPPAGEFTKEFRISIDVVNVAERELANYHIHEGLPKPEISQPWKDLILKGAEACDIIDRAEASNADLLAACEPFARLADMIPKPDAPDPQWRKFNTAIRALPLDRYREARVAVAKAKQ